VSFIFKFVADFKKSMAESAAEHRGAKRKAAGRERRRRNAVDSVTELEEHKKHWSEHCRRSLVNRLSLFGSWSSGVEAPKKKNGPAVTRTVVRALGGMPAGARRLVTESPLI
jgi:hypothetical protein